MGAQRGERRGGGGEGTAVRERQMRSLVLEAEGAREGGIEGAKETRGGWQKW